jgi:anti-anti-sigma factor
MEILPRARQSALRGRHDGGAVDIVEAKIGQVVVMVLAGRLDSASVRDFSDRINAQFDAGANALLMDMANLAYVTSAAFRALALAHRRAKECGTALALCGLNAIVNELFDLTGFSGSFAIYPSREAGLSALARPAV